MCIPSTDLRNFVVKIFGNCLSNSNFAFLYQVNDEKYQNHFADAYFY